MAHRAILRNTLEDQSLQLLIRTTDPVAIQTAGPLVAASETVVSPLMIELDPPPAVDSVTRQTVIRQHETVESRLMGVRVTSTANGPWKSVAINSLPRFAVWPNLA